MTGIDRKPRYIIRRYLGVRSWFSVFVRDIAGKHIEGMLECGPVRVGDRIRWPWVHPTPGYMVKPDKSEAI